MDASLAAACEEAFQEGQSQEAACQAACPALPRGASPVAACREVASPVEASLEAGSQAFLAASSCRVVAYPAVLHVVACPAAACPAAACPEAACPGAACPGAGCPQQQEHH